MTLMLVVRELATNHLLARGALLLHAAAFVLDENGVLILGPSGSGKTTLLLAALG
jgi:ABC-type Fe3+/spermidine/putrescine transport system ATPase subunit